VSISSVATPSLIDATYACSCSVILASISARCKACMAVSKVIVRILVLRVRSGRSRNVRISAYLLHLEKELSRKISLWKTSCAAAVVLLETSESDARDSLSSSRYPHMWRSSSGASVVK
jgi:hypothetical protein